MMKRRERRSGEWSVIENNKQIKKDTVSASRMQYVHINTRPCLSSEGGNFTNGQIRACVFSAYDAKTIVYKVALYC